MKRFSGLYYTHKRERAPPCVKSVVLSALNNNRMVVHVCEECVEQGVSLRSTQADTMHARFIRVSSTQTGNVTHLLYLFIYLGVLGRRAELLGAG